MLFLDLDGTLLDVTRRHYATYVDVLESAEMRGVPIPPKEYWVLRREGKPPEELLKRSRLFPTKFKPFVERFEERLESPELLLLNSDHTRGVAVEIPLDGAPPPATDLAREAVFLATVGFEA